MTYTVQILRSAQKQLAKVERTQQPRIIEAIRNLADIPRPPGSKKLTGRAAFLCAGRHFAATEQSPE